MDHLFISIISWIVGLHLIIHTTSTTRDISDYTFYYDTYHYVLPTISTETTTIYNPQLELYIKIHFSPSTILLFINNHTFDLLQDESFDEISTISSLHSYSSKRSLQQSYNYDNYIPKIREGIRHGKSWMDANHYCKTTRRGHLSTVHDEGENAEQTDICSKLGFKDWHCWLGLKRPFTKWIDFTDADFVNWMPGEPKNFGGNENCVELYTDNNENWGLWNDLKCSTLRSFICEKEDLGEEEQQEEGAECEECKHIQIPQRRRLLCGPNCAHGGHKTSAQRFKEKTQRESQEHWQKERERAQTRMRKKTDKESAQRRARAKERRRRSRWRAHLRELRRKHREEIMEDYQREQKFEKQRDAGFRLLDKLIGSALGFKHGLMSMRRRMMDSNKSVNGIRSGVEMMARCMVMCNADSVCYEICVNYNVADTFISVDLRYVEHMKRKMEVDTIDFRRDNGVYDDSEDEDMIEDAITSYLGYVVNKYERMKWHQLKSNYDEGDDMYVYGEYKELNDYLHYFAVYELYYNHNKGAEDVYVECSKKMMDLPYKMCMKQISDSDGRKDMMLYFEREGEDVELKEVNDVLEDHIFYYNDDRMWDEISTIHGGNDMQWIKKCSFKLLVAKICVEQFHVDDSRASIKFLSKQTYNVPL